MSAPALSGFEQWATFSLGGELYGLPVADVREVLRPQPITPVPLGPDHVLGLLALRGEIMAAVDLGRRLGGPRRPLHHPGRVVIVRFEHRSVGLVVDDIGDVVELSAGGWQPTPEALTASRRTHVVGVQMVDGKVMLGLRLASLLASEAGAA